MPGPSRREDRAGAGTAQELDHHEKRRGAATRRRHAVAIDTNTQTDPTGERSPNDEPHPALDAPVNETRDRHYGKVDKVVFGVTAALAVGFLLWGFLSTKSLASASSTSLDWIVHNMGWLFVVLASGFVALRDLAGGRPVRQHPARQRRRGAGVQDRLLDRDDVQRRHGYRPDVLRRRASR